MLDHFRLLFRYDYWANSLMIDAHLASELDDEFNTKWLQHIVNAQALWLSRVLRQPPSRQVWQVIPWDQLRVDYAGLHQQWIALFDRTTEAELATIVPYQNSMGNAFSSSLTDIATHVVNHGTHHRAQVAARLRELSYAPPSTDYIFWRRSN